WVTSTDENWNFDAYWSFVESEIEKDGTYGISGPAAPHNGLKLANDGTVGMVKAVGKKILDAMFGSSKFAETIIQGGMAKAYGMSYSVRMMPRKVKDVTNFGWKDVTPEEAADLAKFKITQAMFERTTFAYYPDGSHERANELVKGNNFAVHISYLKDDVWEPRLKGVFFDSDTGLAEVTHEIMGGSGLVEVLGLEYQTKMAEALQGAKHAEVRSKDLDESKRFQVVSTLLALGNGISGTDGVLDQAEGLLKEGRGPQTVALQLYLHAKRLLVGRDHTERSKEAAIELLKGALAADPEDSSGLIRPLFYQLQGLPVPRESRRLTAAFQIQPRLSKLGRDYREGHLFSKLPNPPRWKALTKADIVDLKTVMARQSRGIGKGNIAVLTLAGGQQTRAGLKGGDKFLTPLVKTSAGEELDLIGMTLKAAKQLQKKLRRPVHQLFVHNRNFMDARVK
ncbi:MAG TPA: hypothetical protein VI874_01965, partial [Candidatus Norongarragalinales archaeon]|nr:hypothetical protein [Candidatus Norongarragalinales archaeon]